MNAQVSSMADASNETVTLDTVEDESRRNEEEEEEEEVPTTEEQDTPATTLYPKILKLKDFMYKVNRTPSLNQSAATTIPLIGSTKLHGTHADIVFESATATTFRLQSRHQLEVKTGKLDNAGFAAWVASLGEDGGVMLRLRDNIVRRYQALNPGSVVEGEVIIAAEWCGMGVQKKVAISKVPRFMAIISLFVNGSWVPDCEYVDIEDTANRIYNIGRGGFFRHDLRSDDVGLPDSETELTRLTIEVEKECPFAKRVFGVSGLGEGIVWKAVDYSDDPRYWFKAKGDEHAVSHLSKMPASALEMENRERVTNFAKAIVTENRLEQGWGLLHEKTIENLGSFLKWVTEDCLVEERLDMERLVISKRKLTSAIGSVAAPWFKKQLENYRSNGEHSLQKDEDGHCC